MSQAKRQAIARLGGRAGHVLGVAHTWTREEAKSAGRKGGLRRTHPTEVTPEKATPEPKPTGTSDAYTRTDGYKVRQIRVALKESQRVFAKRFNVSQALVYFWEANRETPPQEVLTMQQSIPDLHAKQG
jgi:DNA-binding transcriptional regulator YiaG